MPLAAHGVSQGHADDLTRENVMNNVKHSRCGASGRARLPANRVMFGTTELELLRDGRVVAVLPAADAPLGVAVQATALYPSLGAFLAAARKVRS